MSKQIAKTIVHRIISIRQKFGTFKVATIVNQDKCTRCARCERACPSLLDAIHVDKRNGVSIDMEHCIGCGHCEKVCKTRAIKVVTP